MAKSSTPTTVTLHRSLMVRFNLGELIALEQSTGRGLFDIAAEIQACSIQARSLDGRVLSDHEISDLSADEAARLVISPVDAEKASRNLKLSTIFELVAASTGTDVDELKEKVTPAQIMRAWPVVAAHFFIALSEMAKDRSEPASGETPAVAENKASSTA